MSSAQRYAWVDFSKGICIFGVVSFYAVYLVHLRFGSEGWMQHWVNFARPFRMPDFFLLSGLFLGRVINRPWREFVDKKVVHFVYFYLLWTLLLYVALQLLIRAEIVSPIIPRSTENLALWLAEPFGMLWFIHILPFMFVVSRLLKAVPWYLVLACATVLQMFPIWDIWGPIGNFCERYIFFYIGYKCAENFFAIANWSQGNKRKATWLVFFWIVFNQLVVMTGRSSSKGIAIFLGVLGAIAIIMLGTLLSEVRWMRWLGELGKHSLVTYLGFYLPAVAVVFLLPSNLLGLDVGTATALITLIGVFLPQLLFRNSKNSWVGYLFSRPNWASIMSGKSSASVGS